MLRVRSTLVVAVLIPFLLPSTATAQRGFGGGKGGADAKWDDIAQKAPSGPTISRGDFEKLTPFKFWLDKKKDLKLTDAQIATLTAADAKLGESNDARLTLVDSLKKEMKPRTSGTPSAEDETRMVLAREAMMGTVRDIHASYTVAAKEALAGFDESQRKTAEDLLAKNDEKLQEMIRSKVGGGRGGMGPGGGRGARGGKPPQGV